MIALFAARLAAQDAVPADKGSLSGSGKFLPKEASSVPAPDPAARLAELGVQVRGEKLTIGLVELDRAKHTVSFPAKVQMSSGVIEYFLVHAKGKVHETLFVTDAQPQDIHVACLLAGFGGNKDHPPVPVAIEASWETNGPPRHVPAENLVAIAKDHPQGTSGGHLEPGPWNYTGSTMDAAGFAATREGSIVSLISDPAALVSNPRPGRVDDTMHVPNAGLLPSAGVPVRIMLQLSTPPLTENPIKTQP